MFRTLVTNRSFAYILQMYTRICSILKNEADIQSADSTTKPYELSLASQSSDEIVQFFD